MKQISFIALILLYATAMAHGQNLQLKGKVISGQAPVEFANVVLQTSDSAFVAGGTTDQRGHFYMKNLQQGSYQLKISGIGYQTKQVELAHFAATVDLGTIAIDSTTVMLDEVTVTANPIINQPDKKLVFPTARQIKVSQDGLTLLKQLQLNRIQVDPVQKTISSSNQGEVQLRINGSTAEIQEVLAIRPEDVIRIEYHDEPGLRYGANTAAVINYIVRRHETGGYIGTDLTPSVNTGWGDYTLNAKVNHKKSEFGLNVYGGYRSFNQYWRENVETFRFENRVPLTRTEDGIPNSTRMNWNNLNLKYSFHEENKWFVNVAVRGNINTSHINTVSDLYPIDKPHSRVRMSDYKADKGYRPAIDVYVQRELRNQQAVILNVVGTYIRSNNQRDYEERRESELLTDIYSGIKGDKYSLISEGIYEKGLKQGRLSTGIRHLQSITENRYSGTSQAITTMQEANTTAYIEYMGKLKRFNYTVGIQGKRAWFNQEGEGFERYCFLPRIKLNYNFSDNAYVRYQGQIRCSAPELGDLNHVEQMIDSLQIRRGNPNLKLSTIYEQSVAFNLRTKLLRTNFNLFYQYQSKPNMEQTLREGDLFVRTIAQQRSWQKVNPELELRVGPIKDLLSVSVATGLNYFDSRGVNYHHTYTNWYYRIDAMANYKNFGMFFEMRNHKNDFYGETLTYGENFHILGVTYQLKQLNVGVFGINLFSNNYRTGNENFNAVAPSKNWSYFKESSCLVAMKLSWNFSFGRKYESRQKRLNNEDTTSGTLKSGK